MGRYMARLLNSGSGSSTEKTMESCGLTESRRKSDDFIDRKKARKEYWAVERFG